VPFLAPALLLAGMYVFAPGLAIAKRTGLSAIINFVGAVMNTILNFLLIPGLGIRGAGLATLSSAAFVFAAYMVTSQATYHVPHEWRRLAAGTAVTVAAFLVGETLGPPSWQGVIVKGLIFAGVAVALVLAGLVRRDEIGQGTGLARRLLTRSGG
jgi:O-antigen/teichoic acid export membrane protein